MMTKSKSKRWKNFKLIFAIPIIFLSLAAFTKNRSESSNGNSGQHTELNQLELFKQFVGIWTNEKSIDTTYIFEFKLYGDSLKTFLKYETKGKTFREQNGLFAYDKKSDKMTGLMIGQKQSIAMWFTKNNVCESGPILDNSIPIKVETYRKTEFKSDDLLSVSVLVNEKYINEIIVSRKK